MTDNEKPKRSNNAPRRRNRRGGKRKNNNTSEATASAPAQSTAPTKEPSGKGGGTRNNNNNNRRRGNKGRQVEQEPISPTPQYMEYVTGELFDNVVEASLIVIEANPEGVANTQAVIQLRTKYPEFYAEYLHACEEGTFQEGAVLFTQARDGRHLGLVCTYRDKYLGLVDSTTMATLFTALREYIDGNTIETIAMPPLGGGIGLLNWPRVRRHINHAFKGWNGKIFVYVKVDKVERVN
jgi:O-acetyl-ADP-ribose deacetylase (regulator of RNase III)